MFSPYMMLHVLFFLDLLWDVKGAELCLSPPVAFTMDAAHFFYWIYNISIRFSQVLHLLSSRTLQNIMQKCSAGLM